VRDEDRLTLRQSMFPEESGLIRDSVKSFIVDKSTTGHEREDAISRAEEKRRRFEDLTDKLGLKDLLDLPLVALSNGQTRRARIVKALLEQPDILLLDEPLTGLDFKTRPTLLGLLHSVHASNNPRIIMGLRLQDPVPDWISHIALVQDGCVKTGQKTTILQELNDSRAKEASNSTSPVHNPGLEAKTKVFVDMQNVNVRYHERHVLKDINWTIRSGDRWHLQGANGKFFSKSEAMTARFSSHSP